MKSVETYEVTDTAAAVEAEVVEEEIDMSAIDTTSEAYRMASAVLDYLSTLHSGEEISTMQAVYEVMHAQCDGGQDTWIQVNDFMEDNAFTVHSYVWDLAGDRGLALDASRYENELMGLPYNIPYKVVRL